RPTTSGTVTVSGPLEIVSVTGVPRATDDGPGLWVTTEPAATASSKTCSGATCTVSPAEVSRAVASSWVRPVTSGTPTGACPRLTTTLTAVPGGSCSPAAGEELRTCPAGTVW